ncbi:MAG: TraB/GumN family protein [Calditrichota bacterium]
MTGFRYVLIFGIILILAGCSSPKALLWEISHDSLENPSYLYGTVHVIGESDFIMHENAETALSASEQLVLELNPTSPDVQSELIKAMAMTDGQTLQSILGDDFDAVAAVFADSFNLDLNQLNRIKPFFVASMIIPKLLNEAAKSYELVFIEKAVGLGIGIAELETVADQVGALDQMSHEEQAEMLRTTAFEIQEQREMFKYLVELYHQEDIKKLNKASVELSDMQDFEAALLTKRNQNWIPLIETFIKEKSSFIAVGAAHLAGDEGVIKLLKEAGYKLTPLPSSGVNMLK